MKKFKYSEITPEKIYKNRRSFIKSIGLGASSLAISTIPFANKSLANERDKLTSYKDITTYNNYYEFGTSKGDPYRNSQIFKTSPWDISIEGEVEKPIKLSMEEISEMFVSEERIYRLRCVEGWSMVIPWMGFSLSELLSKVNPTNKAKFVENMPTSSWMWASPREYGFYSNVNPNVDHPRWSQATERIIGEGVWAPRVKTLMFNGYGDEVASLYTGMDLKKYF